MLLELCKDIDKIYDDFVAQGKKLPEQTNGIKTMEDFLVRIKTKTLPTFKAGMREYVDVTCKSFKWKDGISYWIDNQLKIYVIETQNGKEQFVCLGKIELNFEESTQ